LKWRRGRRLDTATNADMMSDMKTFTVRELDRCPRQVLQACRSDGKARIRERGGKTYVITPEALTPTTITALPDFAARRAKLFAKVLPRAFARKLDQALASE
jgi:hypothetical protein